LPFQDFKQRRFYTLKNIICFKTVNFIAMHNKFIFIGIGVFKVITFKLIKN